MSDTQSWAGRFIWRELRTPDPEGAMAFYGTLFGWQWKTIPMPQGPYRMFTQGEDSLGAVVAADNADPAGAGWLPYLTVDDVAAAVETVRTLGGQVLREPHAIPGVGAFALISDDVGARAFLMRSETPGASDTSERVGAFNHEQLLTDDAAKSSAFFQTLVGWRAEPTGGAASGAIFWRGDDARANCLQRPPDATGPSHWLSYVCSADVDATFALAVEHGATAIFGPATFPGFGRFGLLQDPWGAQFGVLAPAR